MRVTGDGGEVSAAAEKQRRMLPRCKECSPPHLFSLAVLAWVVVFGLSVRDLWTLCPAGGAESVCAPYRMLNFRQKKKLEWCGFEGGDVCFWHFGHFAKQ